MPEILTKYTLSLLVLASLLGGAVLAGLWVGLEWAFKKIIIGN